MPKAIRTEFIKKGCEVIYNSNIKISDRFLMQQDSFDNDTLYYKKIIKINEEYPGIMDDVREFLKINYKIPKQYMFHQILILQRKI